MISQWGMVVLLDTIIGRSTGRTDERAKVADGPAYTAFGAALVRAHPGDVVRPRADPICAKKASNCPGVPNVCGSGPFVTPAAPVAAPSLTPVLSYNARMTVRYPLRARLAKVANDTTEHFEVVSTFIVECTELRQRKRLRWPEHSVFSPDVRAQRPHVL